MLGVSLTKRDVVWTYVLNKTHRKDDAVSSADVSEELPVSERTARDTLHVMESGGFIQRKRRGQTVYYAAPEDGL